MATTFSTTAESLTRTATLPTIASWTMMAWMKLGSDINDWNVFWSYGATTGSNFYLVGTGGDGVTLNVWNGSSEGNGSAFTVGAWTHIATTVAGTGASQFLIYVNGALALTHNGFTGPTNAQMMLGNNPDGGRFAGCLAAFKIYSGVLTANQIKGEMRTYMPVRVANLNSWYPLLQHTDVDQFGPTFTAAGTLATEAGPPISWSLRPSTQRENLAAVLGRTTKNVHSFGLGMQHGMGLGMGAGGRYLP